MRVAVIVAALVAVASGAALFAILFNGEGRVARDAGQELEASAGADSDREGLPGFGGPNRVPRPSQVPRGGAGAAMEPTASPGSQGETLADSSGPRAGAGGLKGEGAEEAGSSTPGRKRERSGEKGKNAGTKPLQGTQLTQAIATALEGKDWAAIQGLLISGLTKSGTRFAEEDIPALFDALGQANDFGIQKLILTHLERVDTPPERLVEGYLDYLQNAERQEHSEQILSEIVHLGGDAAVEGLMDLVRSPERMKLAHQAAQALARLGDPRGVSALSDALRGAGDAREATPFLSALATMGGEKAILTLVDYASREGNESALNPLAQIRDREAAPILAEALNGRSSLEYQRAALRQLRRMADARVLPDLDQYLGRADEGMAREAILVIAGIRDPHAARILAGYAERNPDTAIGKYAARAAMRLLAGLSGSSGERRGEGRPRR